jgi:carbon monoxide dehydrogenase subunit G
MQVVSSSRSVSLQRSTSGRAPFNTRAPIDIVATPISKQFNSIITKTTGRIHVSASTIKYTTIHEQLKGNDGPGVDIARRIAIVVAAELFRRQIDDVAQRLAQQNGIVTRRLTQHMT